MMKIITVPRTEELTEAFEPYLSALGRVSHAWNRFHERLARLFVQISTDYRNAALADWYSVRSDRAQRNKLISAIERDPPAHWNERLPSAREDLVWMLQEANKLAILRNVAIHAPCELGIDAEHIIVMPSYFQGNPRAKDLVGKNILEEFWVYEKSTEALTIMVQHMESALIDVNYPWPERPVLPTSADVRFVHYKRNTAQD